MWKTWAARWPCQSPLQLIVSQGCSCTFAALVSLKTLSHCCKLTRYPCNRLRLTQNSTLLVCSWQNRRLQNMHEHKNTNFTSCEINTAISLDTLPMKVTVSTHTTVCCHLLARYIIDSGTFWYLLVCIERLLEIIMPTSR